MDIFLTTKYLGNIENCKLMLVKIDFIVIFVKCNYDLRL